MISETTEAAPVPGSEGQPGPLDPEDSHTTEISLPGSTLSPRASVPGVRKIGSAIALYRIVLLVEAVTVPVSIAFGYPVVAGIPFSASFVPSDTPGITFVGSPIPLLVLGLVGLVLLILSYARWWDGTAAVNDHAPTFGPTHVARTARARKYCTATLAVYLLQLFLLSFVGLARLLANLGASMTNGGSGASSTVVQSIIGWAVGIDTIFAILVYTLAGTSLLLALKGTVPPSGEQRLRTGRNWLWAGAAATILGVGIVVDPWLGLLTMVPYVLIYIGMSKLLGVYRAWTPPREPEYTGHSRLQPA